MSSDSEKPKKITIGSRRKDEIFTFVKEYIAENGFSPSVREICKGVGLSSTSSVHRYLREMMEDGRISNAKNRPRTIMPESIDFSKKTGGANVTWVPVLRNISSGTIDLSSDNIRAHIGMPNDLSSDKEMCGVQIGEKDPFNNGYQQGDIVFFYVPDTEATDGQLSIFCFSNTEIAGVFHPAKQAEVP